MQVNELAQRARDQLSGLTGLKVVTVSRVTKLDLGWRVSLDMLEMSRIPQATDVLGAYDVVLDSDGNMLEFQRTRTRLRADAIDEAAD